MHAEPSASSSHGRSPFPSNYSTIRAKSLSGSLIHLRLVLLTGKASAASFASLALRLLAVAAPAELVDEAFTSAREGMTPDLVSSNCNRS